MGNSEEQKNTQLQMDPGHFALHPGFRVYHYYYCYYYYYYYYCYDYFYYYYYYYYYDYYYDRCLVREQQVSKQKPQRFPAPSAERIAALNCKLPIPPEKLTSLQSPNSECLMYIWVFFEDYIPLFPCKWILIPSEYKLMQPQLIVVVSISCSITPI